MKIRHIKSDYAQKLTDDQLLSKIDYIIDTLSLETKTIKNRFMFIFNVLSDELKRRGL